jgi:uncharacterized iron-regulated protein
MKQIKIKHSLCVFLFCSLLLIGLQSFCQVTEKNYRIYSVKLDKEITLNDIADNMKDYDVIFFGEEHNDSVTHYLENKLLEALYQKYSNNITLSMEMFTRDAQTVMNEYLQGFVKEKTFRKDANVWSNYKDYRPMVEFAKKNKLDVICANAPSRYSNLAGNKGQSELMKLPVESKKNFAPLPYDTATGKYYEKLTGVSIHDMVPSKDTSSKKMPPMMPPMGSFNLVMAQSLWDATMAYSISEYLNMNKGKKVMQVNGRFHSDEGFAVVTQLKKYSPKIKILVISTGTEDSFPNIDWSKLKQLGDYIIITDPTVPKTYKD